MSTQREDEKQARASELRDKFQGLYRQWKKDTWGWSNMYRASKHPACEQIVSMGWDVVPLMIADQYATGSHWFIQLNQITGENPIKEEHRGRIVLMAQDWWEWWLLRGAGLWRERARRTEPLGPKDGATATGEGGRPEGTRPQEQAAGEDREREKVETDNDRIWTAPESGTYRLKGDISIDFKAGDTCIVHELFDAPPDPYPDNEADGVVFCGKCGHQR